MKKIIVLMFFVFVAFNVIGQNYVGFHKLEIKSKMKEKYPDFYFSKEVLGKSSFIKFEDRDGYRTLLFVLDDDGYCKYHIMMCDYSLLKEMVDSLNRNCEYQNNLIWYNYISGKNNFMIKVKKEEWYFSIITKKLEEN